MCNAFLWKGTLEGRYVARVAWDTVTLPKKQGGLGLRNLEPRIEHARSNSFGSLLFKQILQERQTALQWFQINPGDGTNISFWKDPWTKFGKLINFIGHTGPRLTGIHLDASVADVWRDGGWLIHSARSSEMEELLTYLTTITLTNAPSSPYWINNGRNMRSFSSSHVYNCLLPTTPTVPWRPLIWIKRGIPKH